VARRIAFLALTLLVVMTAGCGGGSSTPSSPPAPAPQVSVSPNNAAVRVDETQQFTAIATGVTNPTIVWSVNGTAGGNATVGTISAAGLYTAPSAIPAGGITVQATVSSVSASGTALVTLQNPIPLLASATPAIAPAGAFTITATGSKFVNGASILVGGTAQPTTFVSATQLTANVNITATGAASITVRNPDPGAATSAASSTITVASVAVTPTPVTMFPGDTQQFASTVAGASNTAVNWLVNGIAGGNASVGTVSATGLYTAPANPVAGVSVTAVLQAAANVSGSATANVVAPAVTAFAAARFLDQSTFGATSASIRQVQLVGFNQFLADQFNATSSTYPDPPDTDTSTNSPLPYQQRFLVNALTGQDQLRQRAAFALQKVWVVSWVVVNLDEQYLTYLRMHQQHAFGTYRQIMDNVAHNPAMGQYQDIANNAGVNIAGSPPAISCNENFGRELMQLFTVGIWQLNQDGSFVLSGGQPVPTYDQAIVEANACALTGWTYMNPPGFTRNWPRPIYWGGPLEAVENFHDRSSKTLLSGLVLPSGQTAAADVRDTLDNLDTYPSTAPFVSKLLIQQFTTSNPSGPYVSRVAQAYIDGRYVSGSTTFGGGTRGDMRAILAAILLDAEARAGDVPGNSPATFGKLREPVLLLTGTLRAFGAASDGNAIRGQLSNMGQNLFFPPTVFSYFSPEYNIPGTALLGPEFQLHNTATSLVRANFANTFAFGSLGAGTTVDFTAWSNLAASGTDVLLNELDRVLLHGTLSSSARAAITTAVNAVPSSNPLQRARTAIYLVVSSSQYNVQR
jgi:uncharacterized protein (DUF1800 family)